MENGGFCLQGYSSPLSGGFVWEGFPGCCALFAFGFLGSQLDQSLPPLGWMEAFQPKIHRGSPSAPGVGAQVVVVDTEEGDKGQGPLEGFESCGPFVLPFEGSHQPLDVVFEPPVLLVLRFPGGLQAFDDDVLWELDLFFVQEVDGRDIGGIPIGHQHLCEGSCLGGIVERDDLLLGRFALCQMKEDGPMGFRIIDRVKVPLLACDVDLGSIGDHQLCLSVDKGQGIEHRGQCFHPVVHRLVGDLYPEEDLEDLGGLSEGESCLHIEGGGKREGAL